jgi:hypothetical protein
MMLRTALRLGDEQMIFSHRDQVRGEIRVPIPEGWQFLGQRNDLKDGKTYRVIIVERELRSLLEEQ